MTHNAQGESEEPTPFLPHAEAQHKSETERANMFAEFMKARNATMTPEGIAEMVSKWFQNESALKEWKRNEFLAEQAEWENLCKWQAEKLRDRKHHEGFWTFYWVERLEFSPAEGGCFYDRHQAKASFPFSRFADMDSAKMYARDTWGMKFEGDMNHNGRKLRSLSSVVAEVNAGVYHERFPYEHETLRTPHYE